MIGVCYNDIVFKSEDKTLLKEFLNKLKEFHTKDVTFKGNIVSVNNNNNLKNLSSYFGFKEDTYEYNGMIFLLDTDIYYNDIDNEFYFQLATETDCNPCMEYFDDILKDIYDNKISYVYRSANYEMDIYVNTDKKRNYFIDNYNVKVISNNKIIGEENIELLEDVYRFICECFNWKFSNINRIKQRVRKLNKSFRFNKSNKYCNIVEYSGKY